jgi:hypothetical protein
MILDKIVLIKINSRNFNFYKNKIEDIKNNTEYEITIENILPSSHIKINVCCDICNKISKKPYRDYIKSFKKYNYYSCSPKCALSKNKKTNTINFRCDNVFSNEKIKEKIKETNLQKYNVQYPSQSASIRKKIENTNLKNYGVKNALESDIIKNRIKKTNIIKYGTENILSSEYMKDWRLKNGKKIPDHLKPSYKIYQEKVRILTNNSKKELFQIWNGIDYYDNEYIKDNLELKFYDKNYPTIDHKLSIYYGFLNKIDPYIIADINNLCITKRKHNSKKGTKNENNFKIF